MKPIAKNHAEKMSATQVRTLQDQTQELEAMVQNTDQLSTRPQDPGSLQRKLAQNKEILERDENLIASGRQRDAIAREIRQLEEVIRREMPTRSMMNARAGDPNIAKYATINLAFQNKHLKNMLRLKDLKRRLEPNDPEAGNLERIRPD